MTTIDEVKRFKHFAYMDEVKVVRYKKDKDKIKPGQNLYLIQIRSDVSGKFLTYATMTNIKEVERFKKAVCADDVKVIRYRRDKEIKVK
jgi:hypothetical protein